jgi:hypothetical protein
MIHLTDDGQTLTIRLSGWDLIWACRRTVTIPRACISGARLRQPSDRPPWCRCPGTCIPGVIIAGTYLARGRAEFWSMRYRDTLVLELRGHRFTRIVIDVPDPVAWIRRLEPSR